MSTDPEKLRSLALRTEAELVRRIKVQQEFAELSDNKRSILKHKTRATALADFLGWFRSTLRDEKETRDVG